MLEKGEREEGSGERERNIQLLRQTPSSAESPVLPVPPPMGKSVMVRFAALEWTDVSKTRGFVNKGCRGGGERTFPALLWR